ncbi:hypothetical protein [Magnetospirillum fulvum]|nr:hypothetical protein [Magnetospirillum fulvum]
MPSAFVAARIAEARAILARPFSYRASLVETAARVLIQWEGRPA